MKRKVLNMMIYAGGKKIAEAKEAEVKFARLIEKVTVYGASYVGCPICGHVFVRVYNKTTGKTS